MFSNCSTTSLLQMLPFSSSKYNGVGKAFALIRIAISSKFGSSEVMLEVSNPLKLPSCLGENRTVNLVEFPGLISTFSGTIENGCNDTSLSELLDDIRLMVVTLFREVSET